MKLIFGENQRYVLYNKEDALSFEIENTLTGQGGNMSVLPEILKPRFDFLSEYVY